MTPEITRDISAFEQEILHDLEERRQELIAHMREEEEKLHQAEVSNPDRSDLAQEYNHRQKEVAFLEQAEEQLEQIEQAFQRLAEDTYGRCASCGQEIAPGRLRALPYALLCVQCQSIQERAP